MGDFVLKPCGNCGAPARWVELAWRVKCTRPSCGVTGGHFERCVDALKAWNTRAAPQPPEDAVEQMPHGLAARPISEQHAWKAGAYDRLSTPSPREKELEEALRPFARVADMEANATHGESVIVNVDLCRAARALLSKEGKR